MLQVIGSSGGSSIETQIGGRWRSRHEKLGPATREVVVALMTEEAAQQSYNRGKMRRGVLLCVAEATLKRDFEVESRQDWECWLEEQRREAERLASSRQTEAASNSVIGLVPFGPRQDSARDPRKTR